MITDRSGPRPDENRAQTAQDFALGISVFLLAVAFTFAFVPTILAPFDAGTTGSQSAQADRVATTVVGNISAADQPNLVVDNDTLNDEFDTEADLAGVYGLPNTASVNVTVTNISSGEIVGDPTLTKGEPVDQDQQVGTATRIIRTTDDRCDPACRITVRVW